MQTAVAEVRPRPGRFNVYRREWALPRYHPHARLQTSRPVI